MVSFGAFCLHLKYCTGVWKKKMYRQSRRCAGIWELYRQLRYHTRILNLVPEIDTLYWNVSVFDMQNRHFRRFTGILGTVPTFEMTYRHLCPGTRQKINHVFCLQIETINRDVPNTCANNATPNAMYTTFKYYFMACLYFCSNSSPSKYRVIRNDCRVFNNSPPRFPDATPCYFFLWGYVKDQVYVLPLPTSIMELKVRTRTAIETITADMLQTVWNELHYCVDVCRITKGAHIEHL